MPARPAPDADDDATHPPPTAAPDRVSAVVVAYGPEEWLERSVRALLDSTGVLVDVVLVDNDGGSGPIVDELARLDRVQLIRPGTNVGFASGCNIGAAANDLPFVALVNPDAVVAPDALAELVAVARRPEVGIATASVRLADHPDRLNSAGNIVHFLGLSWSGYFDEPAADHPDQREVTSASGAGLLCRREVWDALGGFADEFFAYCEDADLSLRAWLRGWSVVYVPTALVTHRYEFSRNPVKYRLLERNRVIMTWSCFGPRHLLVVAPLLFALEAGTLLLAAKQGWWREKFAGYWWLVRHLSWLRRRRNEVQSTRTRSERDQVRLFNAHLDPANLELPAAVAPVDRILAGYWRVAQRLL